jgi:hypothetical protein
VCIVSSSFFVSLSSNAYDAILWYVPKENNKNRRVPIDVSEFHDCELMTGLIRS